jgi:hypothetical protein
MLLKTFSVFSYCCCCCAGWGYMVAIYKNFYTTSSILCLNSFLDNPPSFPSRNPASTVTISPFTYVYIHYLPYSQPLSPFPYPFCPPTTTDPPRQNLFHPHVLQRRQSEIFGCSDNYIGSFLVACPCLYVL